MPDVRWFKQRDEYKNKKQKAKPPEKSLREKDPKDLEELRKKTREKIIYGDIQQITKFDKYFVQDIDEDSPDAAEVLEKSQYAYLLKKSAYIRDHLRRLVEDRFDFVIAGWYEFAERAFTERLNPIREIYKDVEDVLAQLQWNLREDFNAGYEKLCAVAEQCDIDRTKPIGNFQSAAAKFHKTICAIYQKAFIELNKLTKQTHETTPEQPKLKPLPKRACIIYEKLLTLKPQDGMTLPDIQTWLVGETGKDIDEGTWKKYRKKLLPYGLKNEKRIGYYIEKK